MKKIVRLTESDLTRIVKRIIKEDMDYNETTEEFYEIQDMLIDMANNGKFVLHVADERNGTNDTYGDNESFSRTKKEVYVRINQPMYMVIVPRGTDKYFGRDFTDLLTKQFRAKFLKMNFSGDYGYAIEVRPKKFNEQGFYG